MICTVFAVICKKYVVKKFLILITLTIISLSSHAQSDTASIGTGRSFSPETSLPNISIYPVPVRENYFSIKSDREISAIKVTNIIGQDIFRTNYNNPQSLVKIMLTNPRRGMYLVSVTFTDGSRLVRKIMIEGII